MIWKNSDSLQSEFLIQALADEDRWVRYLAADALANIGATNSVDSLISLLRDPEQDVRFAAAAALGKLGDPKAIKSLQEVLRRDNGYVKVAAEEALIMISPQAAGPAGKGSPVTLTVNYRLIIPHNPSSFPEFSDRSARNLRPVLLSGLVTCPGNFHPVSRMPRSRNTEEPDTISAAVKYLLPEYPADLSLFPFGKVLGNGGNTNNVAVFILDGRRG